MKVRHHHLETPELVINSLKSMKLASCRIKLLITRTEVRRAQCGPEAQPKVYEQMLS
jgi:hypothetical protein